MRELVAVLDSMTERLADAVDPGARWLTLTGVMGLSASDDRVTGAHADVLADPLTADLLDRLGVWDEERRLSGHERPEFAPNLITLLFDIGVTPADDSRLAACLTSMLEHQSEDGRFLALGRAKASDEPIWAALPCDAHAILEVLARAGDVDDPRVRAAFVQVARDLTTTAQGPGWRCLPDPRVGFRGPGRKGDCCPQVTLEALRAFSHLDPAARGAVIADAKLADAARTALGIWRDRGTQQPYMFGHGRGFKEGKWPATWYSALAVVETLGRYPDVWDGPAAVADDRQAMAEVAACLAAYCIDDDAQVAPHSVFTGFATHSFGKRGRPSDLAAAQVLRALHRVRPLAAQIDAVDVRALGSAKGGCGTPLSPR